MLFKLAPPLTTLLHSSALLYKNPSHSLTSTTRFKLQTPFAMKGLPGDRSEIAFFDVETTVPTRPGQRFAILEFGAILVCPKKLEELYSYSELVRPSNPSLITSLSDRCNGIAPDAVASAPTFADIAEKVFDILHGRIWAGHNIVRFDCVRIREAFAEIGLPAPEPKGTIDSLALLTRRFGRRAGDMKMASLATYFGLGQQTHRSLDDVRLNLEVLKHCATVLFLESSLPNIFTANSWVSPNATTRSRSNDQGAGEDHPIFSHVTRRTGKESVANIDLSDPFDMGQLSSQMETNSLQPDVTTEEKTEPVSPEIDSTAAVSEGSSDHVGYIEPDYISIPSISTCLVPLYPGSQIQRIKILHGDVILQLRCSRLKVRFGISTKFVDNAGKPRLNFVVDASPSLCRVLDACDSVVAQKLVSDSGSSSEWRPVLNQKNGFVNYPTARLHIPTVVNGDVAQYATEICQKEASGATQRLVFSKFDAAELDALFKPGTFVDAYLSLDPYDYQQTIGIRLVAKKLVIHSE